MDQEPEPRVRGWALVERQLEGAREHLAAARHGEEFQAVGLHCREVLISLAQAVYVRDRHPAIDGVDISPTDSKRMLEAFIAVELAGETNEAGRRHARSALDLANGLQHSRTADYKRAAMCVEATASVVNQIAIAAGRGDAQETVADLIDRYLAEGTVGDSGVTLLKLIARMPIGKKIASKLVPGDFVEHARLRLTKVTAATVGQDISYLNVILTRARDVWNLDASPLALTEAKRVLRKEALITKSTARSRRPSSEEIARLAEYFREYEKRPKSKIPMTVLTEFALWSGRRIGEICRLRWADVNVTKRTCIVRQIRDKSAKGGRDHEFPLLGEAWNIIQRQPRKGELIFPYNSHSASASYTQAKKALGIRDLRLNDMRRETAFRLFESGYALEQVAEVLGRQDVYSLQQEWRANKRRSDPTGVM